MNRPNYTIGQRITLSNTSNWNVPNDILEFLSTAKKLTCIHVILQEQGYFIEIKEVRQHFNKMIVLNASKFTLHKKEKRKPIIGFLNGLTFGEVSKLILKAPTKEKINYLKEIASSHKLKEELKYIKKIEKNLSSTFS